MSDGLNKLRNRLRKANLAEVARRAGVSAPAVRNILTGEVANPGILTVAAIRHALNMIDDEKTGGSAKKASAPTPRAARRRKSSKASKAVSTPTAAGRRRSGAGGPSSGDKRTGTGIAHVPAPVRKVSASAKNGRKAA